MQRQSRAARNRELYAEWKAGDARARETLIVENLWLVSRWMKGLSLPPHMESEDLRSAATVGLICAVDYWTPQKGPLEGYARMWMWKEAEEAARRSRDISVPYRGYATIAQVRAAEDLSPGSKDAAIAERTNLPLRHVRAARMATQTVTRIDDASTGDAEASMIPDRQAEGAYAAVVDLDARRHLCEALGRVLSSRLAAAVIAVDLAGMTRQDAARRLRIGVGTLDCRLQRGRKALRDIPGLRDYLMAAAA